MNTTKITKLRTLFDRALSVESVEKYGEITLIAQSVIPFVKRGVYLSHDDVTKSWPAGKEVLYRMSDIPQYFLNKYGVSILRKALDVLTEDETQFWVLQDGFTLHSQVSGIDFPVGDTIVKFHTKSGEIFTADIRLVKSNNREIARLLVRLQDMRLSPIELCDAITKYGFVRKQHNIREDSDELLPQAISDIVAISRIDETGTRVRCTFRHHNHPSLVTSELQLSLLEERFPKLTQALLASNIGDNLDQVLKAAYIRKWWQHLPADINTPVFFHCPDNIYSMMMSSEYNDKIADKGVVLDWSALKSFGLGGRKGVTMRFDNSSINRSYICDVRTFDAQLAYLGLTSVVDLIKLLDLNEKEGVGPVLTAVYKDTKNATATASLGNITLI